MNPKGMIVLVGALLIGMLLLVLDTCSLKAERDVYIKRNKQLEQEVRDYGILKIYFDQELDSLQQTCDDLARANAEAQLQLMEMRARERKAKSRNFHQ